jgi:hypothetical protein
MIDGEGKLQGNGKDRGYVDRVEKRERMQVKEIAKPEGG